MMTMRNAIVAVAAIAMAAELQAQTTTATTKTPEAGVEVTRQQITGEVVSTEGNLLLARLQPSGLYHVYNISPAQKFVIDGQPKTLSDIRPGTVLTATQITRSQPVTIRTTATVTGTVWYVSGNFVILTLPDGQHREYNVPPAYQFVVDGKPASVSELRKGMKVTGTKITFEPTTEMSVETVITGKSPK